MARSGSLILELKPAYLDGLESGEHTVTALFDDGEVEADFAVKEASVTPKDDSPKAADKREQAKPGQRIPQTGDGLPAGAVSAVLLCGLALLAAGLLARASDSAC